jgi:hypothetical protein
VAAGSARAAWEAEAEGLGGEVKAGRRREEEARKEVHGKKSTPSAVDSWEAARPVAVADMKGVGVPVVEAVGTQNDSCR